MEREPNPLRDGLTQLFDLYRGPHFTALAYGPTAAHDVTLVGWPTGGAGLLRVAVDAPDVESERADRSVVDNTGRFRKNCGIDRDTIVLVRPDGYIASIATKDMTATIASAAALLTPP